MSGASTIDADAFRDFERKAHSERAESYADRFAAVTDRAIAPLLDAARVKSGTRLLDVAAGPGRLSAAAAARGAKVTGSDLAPSMVALAQKHYPEIEFREASADALPFADGAFDAATCAFGVGHFPDAERVLAELVRVLAPGGAVALSWWEGFQRNRINGVFHETIGRLGVSAPGVLPAGPPIDRFSDRERIAEFLRSAGLLYVQVDTVSFRHRLRDADELWSMAMGSFARASTMIGAQTTEMQTRIRAAVAEAAQEYRAGDGLDIPVSFLVASGTKA
ncbi:MAG: class I SAM-dependent methyltransferase [Rhizobiaceae bacterium]